MIKIPIDTAYTLFVLLVDITDDETAKIDLTGLSTEYCRSDGTSFSSFTPTSTTEIGSGVYKIVVPAAQISVAGEIIFRVYKSTVTNNFVTVRYVVDYSAAAEKLYLHDTTINRTAAATLTMERADALANTISGLPAVPHDDHREALVGAIASLTGGWAISGLTVTVKDSNGVTVFERTMASTVGADSANLATGIS